MQMELLPAGADGRPLMRIFGTAQVDFAALLAACRSLAAAPGQTCRLHEHAGFAALNDCRLTMMSTGDGESRCTGGGREVYWSLPPEGWSTVAGLIEPFATEARPGTFQWLAGPEARFGPFDLAVLLSCTPEGRW